MGQTKQQAKIDSLLVELPKKQDDTLKVKLLHAISFAYSNLHPDEGIKYANYALVLAEQLDYPKGIAASNAMLAINYNVKTEYAKAIALNQKALVIYQKLKDKKSVASIYANVSVIYLGLSNYPEALRNSFEALKIYEEFEKDPNTAQILENIGHVYYEQKKYDKTKNYYTKALNIYNESGSQRDIARCMGNMARVFQSEKEYRKALDYLFSALKTNQELGMPNSVQGNMANIGNVYIKLKDYEKAVHYHSEALRISEDLGFKNNIAINNGNLGNTYLRMEMDSPKNIMVAKKPNTIPLAIHHLENAVAICKEIGFAAPQVEFSENLTEAYALADDYKMAYSTLKSSISLRDSIFSQQSQIELSDLETKRDISLKNKDIIIKNKQLEINKLEDKNDRMLYISGILILFIIIFVIVRYLIKQMKSHDNAMANMIRIQSHEIRGPIASILGLSQLFNFNKPDDPANKELIEGINMLANNLDEVVIKVISDTKDKKY